MFNTRSPIEEINSIVEDFDKKIVKLKEAAEVANKEAEHLHKKAALIEEEAFAHTDAADKANRVVDKFKELVC